MDQILGPITGFFKDTFGQIAGLFKKIAEITAWFACLRAFFVLISESIKYALIDFGGWLFSPGGFFEWLGAYIMCAFDKIASFSSCFLWYVLDIIAVTVYFPFRFLFWTADEISGANIQGIVHELWCFIDEIDKFIHDPGPEGLGLGFHIIHFPDSVMRKCYECGVGPMPPLPDPTSFYRAISDFNQSCLGKGKTCRKKCKTKPPTPTP